MLALVVSVAFAQCTKDTECKADRVCSAGACVDAALVPAAPLSLPPLAVVEQKGVNPYRVHIWIAMSGAIASWLLTAAGSLAIGDALFGTTVLPVVGPLVTFLRCSSDPNCYFYPASVPLIFISTFLQAGAVAYLVAAVFRTVGYEPN